MNGRPAIDVVLDDIAERLAARLIKPNGDGDKWPPRRAFNVPQVAHMLGISDRQVRRLIAAGHLAAVNTGVEADSAPHWVVPVDALDAFLQARLSAVRGAQ